MSRHNLHHLRRAKQADPSIGFKQLVLIIATIEPLMTIPQVYQIWSTHNTAGISLLSWAAYLSAAIIWFIYGLRLKDQPIIVSSALWILAEGAVVLGLLIYR